MHSVFSRGQLSTPTRSKNMKLLLPIDTLSNTGNPFTLTTRGPPWLLLKHSSSTRSVRRWQLSLSSVKNDARLQHPRQITNSSRWVNTPNSASDALSELGRIVSSRHDALSMNDKSVVVSMVQNRGYYGHEVD